MWRDEWQAWLLADDSSSFGDLLSDVRHEGHSPLWHLLLYGLSRVGPVELMRLLAAAVAVASTVVVAWFGPFRGWQKPVFALGYFSAFEYLALSRPYGLSALLAFTYAALSWSSTRDHTWWRALLLVLLALTSVYGAMLALVLGAAAVLERWPQRPPAALVPAGAAVTGVGLSLLVARPGETTTGNFSSSPLLNPFLGVDPSRLDLRQLVRALVPIPPLRHDGWWDSSVVDSPRGVVVGLFAAVAVAIVAFGLRRSPVSLAMWAAGIAGFLAFGYVVYTGSIYHYGHLYVLAVAAIWLASTRAGAAVDQRMVVGLLGVQALGGLAAIALDATGPFSNGERVAAFVDREELVVVDPDWSGATVAGERGGTVFMVTSNQQRSFVRWSEARECNESAEPLCLDLDEVLARAERAEADVLVLPPEVRLPPSAPWRRVEVFDGAATDEDFAVHRPAG
jgi:MFS family permease